MSAFLVLSASSDVENINVRKEHGMFQEITLTEEYKIDNDTVLLLEYEEMKVEITAYCNEAYFHICNDGNFGKTSTGTNATVGRTIAVDPTVIPYGTMVDINGKKYIAEDTGGAIKGNRIDLLVWGHDEALCFGRQEIIVRVYK